MARDFDLAPQPPLPLAAADDYSAAALRMSGGPWRGVREHRDVRFGPEPWQGYDVFAPDGDGSGRDVLVFVHGGGWTNGYKEWCGLLAPAVCGAGMVLVAPTHRLAPTVRWPDFARDVAAAIGAFRMRAEEWGADAGRLILAGHSAGGHIAAMLALRPDIPDAPGWDGAAVRACAPVSGILDLHHPGPPEGSLEARVYSHVLRTPEEDRAASPLSHAEAARVPFLLAWGTRDTERVRLSNAGMARRLAAAGRPHLARTYDGDHFTMHLDLADPGHDWHARLAALRAEIPRPRAATPGEVRP